MSILSALLPLLHITTSLVPIRQANGPCRAEHRGSAGRACCVVEPTQCLRIKRQEKRTAKRAVLIWHRMIGTSPLEETHCLWLN